MKAAIAVFACLSVFVVASSASESILGQILSSEYTGLVKLLEESNLLSDLEADGVLSKGVTIFAPSDLYLSDKAPGSLLNFLTQPGHVQHLRKVLLHHMVPGKVNVKSWFPGETVKTLAGGYAKLYLENGELRVSGVPVKELGVLEGSDGIVHGIQGLLIPEDVQQAADEFEALNEDNRRALISELSVVSASAPAPSPASVLTSEIAAALKGFGDLLKLLETYGLLAAIVSLLEGTSTSVAVSKATTSTTLTLFAPTNEALSAVNLSADSNATIDNILQYHVVYGSYSYEELLAIGNGTSTAVSTTTAQTLRSINGATISITNVNGAVFVNSIEATSPNVLVTSDFSIHGISGVLVPPSPASPPPAVTSSPPPPPKKSSGLKVVVSMVAIGVAILSSAFAL